MKSELILLFAIVTMFGGCSTHFYKVNKNDVTIYLRNSDSDTPLFLCSLDGYTAQKMKLEKGLWMVTLPANSPFRYFYLVNGEPFLPACTMREHDDFGSENCVFEPEL